MEREIPPWVETLDGRMVNPVDQTAVAAVADPVELAHRLALICRFLGGCREFYSVAQHSVLVSRLVPPAHALAGLLHDAAEAFLGDVRAPLKPRAWYGGDGFHQPWREVETMVLNAILQRYGVATPLPECVQQADLIALATERRDIVGRSLNDWQLDAEPNAGRIVASDWRKARKDWMTRYRELTT